MISVKYSNVSSTSKIAPVASYAGQPWLRAWNLRQGTLMSEMNNRMYPKVYQKHNVVMRVYHQNRKWVIYGI